MTDQQLLDVLGDWLNGRRDVTPEVADAWVALAALVADLARYRTALEEAADDLDKAATLFDGLGFSLNTAHFAGKAERARAALAGADDQETA